MASDIKTWASVREFRSPIRGPSDLAPWNAKEKAAESSHLASSAAHQLSKSATTPTQHNEASAAHRKAALMVATTAPHSKLVEIHQKHAAAHEKASEAKTPAKIGRIGGPREASDLKKWASAKLGGDNRNRDELGRFA